MDCPFSCGHFEMRLTSVGLFVQCVYDDNLPQYDNLVVLGPGRPSAGGPKMDRRAATSPGVIKISRLASCLRHSARRGPDPKVALIKLLMTKILINLI